MVTPELCLGVILLAAGRSSRMGRPKLLLPWGKTSIMGHLLDQWRSIGAAQVKIVHASDDLGITAELDRLGIPASDRVENPHAARGMFSSILCAAQSIDWKMSLTHWAIVLGDQPHLRQDSLVSLVRFAQNHAAQVCQPMRNGKRRHPVMLPKDVFLQLAQSGAATLKDFLVKYQVETFECNDPGLDLDIDHPEDYQRALALAGLPSP